MKKPKIVMTVTKEEHGYSAHVALPGNFVGTQAESLPQLMKQIIDALNLAFRSRRITFSADDILLKPDLQSFFASYRVVNAKALSERIGMNQSLLAQYIKGIKTPSEAQRQRILGGVKQLGRELASIEFHRP